MLFVLLSLTLSKCIKATARNFDNIVKKMPYSVVLFTNQQNPICRQIQSTMDALSVRYRDAVNMVVVDTADAPAVVAKYDVRFAPNVLVFKRDVMISRYYGGWSSRDLTAFCDALCSEDIAYLNSTFDVLRFQQQRRPANLILSRRAAARAEKLFSRFGGAFHIGVVENSALADELQLPDAQFNRPAEGFSRAVDDVDREDLVKLASSDFVHIGNHNFAGTTAAQNTLFVLLDENDPYHINHAMERMKAAREHFGANMGFQYCDFFTCSNFVNQMNLHSFENPVYLLNSKNNYGSKIDVFKNPINTPKDILDWLMFEIEGVEIPKEKEETEIPRLYASQFIQKVLDPKIDAILLMASPQMQLYKESRKNFQLLIELFKDYKTIKFYEFNPMTEHIQGLQFPPSGAPQISVWPAKSQQSGSLFQAYLPMDTIIPNLLRLVVTKIPNEEIAKLDKKLKELLNQ